MKARTGRPGGAAVLGRNGNQTMNPPPKGGGYMGRRE